MSYEEYQRRLVQHLEACSITKSIFTVKLYLFINVNSNKTLYQDCLLTFLFHDLQKLET